MAGTHSSVGRTPVSGADAHVSLFVHRNKAGQGAGRGPGGPPH